MVLLLRGILAYRGLGRLGREVDRTREALAAGEMVRERELQKVYERVWLPPPVKHSPWD